MVRCCLAQPTAVTGAGAVLQRTVESYGQWLAGHERTHVKQIAKTLATLGAIWA
jgi:hypothetical protein